MPLCISASTIWADRIDIERVDRPDPNPSSEGTASQTDKAHSYTAKGSKPAALVYWYVVQKGLAHLMNQVSPGVDYSTNITEPRAHNLEIAL
jgi:hypothetical protein